MSFTSSQRKGRNTPVSRSSLLGTLKNIVTAPLAWFAGPDEDFEDNQGKRRRVANARTQTEDDDERNVRIKRKRIDSPDRTTELAQVGYLDPPESVFDRVRSVPKESLFHNRQSGVRTTSSSFNFPTRPVIPPGQPQSFVSHDTAERGGASLSKAMSVDPPHQSVHSQIQPSRALRREPNWIDFAQQEAKEKAKDSRRLRRGPNWIDIVQHEQAKDPMAMSIYREKTTSPRRPHVHSSLTPQLSNASASRPGSATRSFAGTHAFRDSDQRKHDAPAPPPLEVLREHPIFVKPPPDLTKPDPSTIAKPRTSSTLGSLMETRRSSMSPVRQGSSILFGAGPSSLSYLLPSSSSSPALHPSQRAFQELEMYKTPLLPTRLKGATTLPDMFKSPPSQASRLKYLMRDVRDDRPRLGMPVVGKKKEKDEEKKNATKPYAGSGGMKKWLAKRRKEEEEEAKRKVEEQKLLQEEAMEDDSDEVVVTKKKSRRSGKKAQGLSNGRQDKKPEEAPKPEFRVESKSSGRETSSLRVGRTRISRIHGQPLSLSRPKNKFSAKYDDDDDDEDAMLDDAKEKEKRELQEAAQRAPIFEVPPGFTFAKETPLVLPITADAKEPPISALPFSLTSSTSPRASCDNTVPPVAAQIFSPPAANPPQAAENVVQHDEDIIVSPTAPSDFATQQNLAPASTVESPFVEPPRPVPSLSSPSAASTTSIFSPVPSVPSSSTSIPNFFSNSAILSNTPLVASLSIPSVPNFTSTPSHPPVHPSENSLPVTEKGEKIQDAVFAADAKSAPSLFGDALNRPLSAPSQLFGSNLSSTEPAPVPAPSFDVASDITPGSIRLTSSVSPTPGLQSNNLSSAKLEGSTPPPSLSPLGAPAQDAASKSAVPSAVKNLLPVITKDTPNPPSFFANPPATPAFSFGAQPTTSTATQQTTFPPHQQNAPPTTPSALGASPNAIEAPKPLFGSNTSFSFGQRPTTAPAGAGEEKPAVSNAFAFNATPITPPAAEKKAVSPFQFVPPASAAKPASSPFSFGAPSATSNASDVSSKPFVFGQPANQSRPITPPKTESQDSRMDESPTRDVNMNGNGNGIDGNNERPSLGGFSFGNPSTPSATLFGQSAQPTTTPAAFSFGTSASNPFASKVEDKQENKLGPSFNWNQPASSAPFSFGQTKESAAPAASSSTITFAFGQSPTSSSSSPFAFGAAATPTNGFGQSTPSPASPSAPSPFGLPQQPQPFAFGAPAAPAKSNFVFGASSQPASPAIPSVSLPQPPASSGGGFMFGQPAAAPAPPVSFNVPPAATQPPPGGALFTIGAAPPSAPGGRQIKKLPSRRGGRR